LHRRAGDDGALLILDGPGNRSCDYALTEERRTTKLQQDG
jgi:hypothetical protein